MKLEINLEDITMSDIMMFLAIMIGVALVFWVIVKIARRGQEQADASCPIQRAMATVVDKQQLPAGSVTFSSLSRIWIMFDLEDGSRIKLFDSVSSNLIVGDTGRLCWQGDSIISFSRGDGAYTPAARRGQAQTQPGTWMCSCGCENAMNWETCAGCGKKRPEE